MSDQAVPLSEEHLTAMIVMAATVQALCGLEYPKGDTVGRTMRRLRPWADDTIRKCQTGNATLTMPPEGAGYYVAKLAWRRRDDLPEHLRPAHEPDRSRLR